MPSKSSHSRNPLWPKSFWILLHCKVLIAPVLRNPSLWQRGYIEGFGLVKTVCRNSGHMDGMVRPHYGQPIRDVHYTQVQMYILDNAVTRTELHRDNVHVGNCLHAPCLCFRWNVSMLSHIYKHYKTDYQPKLHSFYVQFWLVTKKIC